MTHQTVGLAAHAGAARANASVLDEKASPLKAMLTAVSGMVGKDSLDAARADATERNTTAGDGKLPHSTDPIIAIAARDGMGANAGQSLQLANGETVTLMSGQDTQFVTGGQMRVHTGQAIGVLAGAVKAGEGNIGLQLIAAKDSIEIQAQADELKVQARDEVNVISANAHIDWAAAKRISLSTAGGANITIDGGNITVQCPGKITIHAGKKSFFGPENLAYPMPKLPRSELIKRTIQFRIRLADTPGPNGHALTDTPWKITYGDMPDGLSLIDEKKTVAQGLSDAKGNLLLTGVEEEELAAMYASHPDNTWLVYPGHVVRLNVQTESSDWDEKQKLLQALNAADFSPDLHASTYADGALPQARYAKEAFQAASSSSIFPNVKA